MVKQFVDIKEASHLTGLSFYALRKGVALRRFPFVRAGHVGKGKILFDIELLAHTLATEALENTIIKEDN